MEHTIVICIEILLWYHKLCHTRLQGVGNANLLEPLYGVRLSEAREHILATEQSEGASYALKPYCWYHKLSLAMGVCDRMVP